jgi:hypothetical protein
MSDFTVSDGAYTEPFDKPAPCTECRADVSDGHAGSHELTCSQHPDYRADLDELDEAAASAAVAEAFAAMQRKGAA